MAEKVVSTKKVILIVSVSLLLLASLATGLYFALRSPSDKSQDSSITPTKMDNGDETLQSIQNEPSTSEKGEKTANENAGGIADSDNDERTPGNDPDDEQFEGGKTRQLDKTNSASDKSVTSTTPNPKPNTVSTEELDPKMLAKFDQIVQRSDSFINEHVGFRPVEANAIKNIAVTDSQKVLAVEYFESSKILVHKDVYKLIEHFLEIKKQFGSSIEKNVYKNMSKDEFVVRLFEKRPLAFINASDSTTLRNRDKSPTSASMWDKVGTEMETSPLILQDYLSYDEIAIGALLGISSPVFLINDGNRNNSGSKGMDGNYIKSAVYVGLVGARFERKEHMEARFMLPNLNQTGERGYGEGNWCEHRIMQMWADFYNVPRFEIYTGQDFNVQNYKRRMQISLELFFIDANQRGIDANQKVYAFVVGLGLGVWKFVEKQAEWYVQVALEVLRNGRFDNIRTVDFSYISKVTLENIPAGISCVFSTNDPFAVIPVFDENGQDISSSLLRVAMYAWDGNSFPGNEYWFGALSASGDPAAASCSTISEAHNIYVNPSLKDNIQVLGL